MFLKNFKIGQKMFLGFGFITLLMLVVLGYNYLNFTKVGKTVYDNIHSYNVINESNNILISLVNMETGARGYAITGKNVFLEPYNQGKIEYDKHYGILKSLTVANPVQQDQLNLLNSDYLTWLNWETNQLIVGRQKVSSGQSKMEDLISVVQQGNGKKQMDNLRLILSNIIKEEQSLLDARRAELVKTQDQTRIVLLAGGGLAAIFAVLIALLVIRMVVNPVRTVTDTFKGVSEDDVNLEIRLKENSNDELGEMAKYFNKFMSKLKVIINENNNQAWLKTGQAELNEKISGEQDLLTLGSKIITYVSKYINAQVGAIYIKADDDKLKMFGSYAYSRRKNLSNQFVIGEGIIGQAALEKNTIVLGNVPEDYVKIVSGLGEASPRNIIAAPCLYNNEVVSLIELGTVNELTDVQIQFIEQISSSIGVAIHSANSRIQMKELLNKTLEQSEELQVQQEELMQNNEELEEQTTALKESEARLQSQQEELRVVNEELEERTKGLELQKNDIIAKNENLRKAKIEIEEKAGELEVANRYKSEFLANMSHELRTPLNSILVLSKMLAEKKENTPLTEKQLEFASTIHSSGEDLLKLINDILDISKVEAGKMEVNYEDLNMSELVQYVERSFRPIAVQKGIDFKVETDKAVPINIKSDTLRVQQIVNNLISNALKFTHQGAVTMNIGVTDKYESSDGDKDILSIAISDTGIGIPVEKQNVIFEAFKQSDGTTSRKYGGTGLGLSISKELARLLGGSISVKSEEGVGSTFALLLPFEKKDGLFISVENEEEAAADKSPDIPMDNKLVNEPVSNLKDKTLLIIEDDINFSNILFDLASDKGYKSIVANNGEKGVKLAIEYRPDAILLDIGLPDINGWKVIENLSENSMTKNIPVHIISGGEIEPMLNKSEGIIGCLRKPAAMEDLNGLFKKIEKLINKSFKKILIIDEDADEIKNISELLKDKYKQIFSSDCGNKAFDIIKNEQVDTLILDLKLKDMPGMELLARLRKENLLNLPVIIYTDKELTIDEEAELNKYAESIIIKGSHSADRLIAEASLFLHDLELKSEDRAIDFIKSAHQKEALLNNKKILIVDDDMRNVFALSSVLEEKGIQIVVGRNGKEAIRRLNEEQGIDLVLMDVMMPEMDGYTAMREIRKMEKFSKMPIIAITAKAMKDDRDRCIDAGANDYLTKPIDIEKLVSLLRVWLY